MRAFLSNNIFGLTFFFFNLPSIKKIGDDNLTISYLSISTSDMTGVTILSQSHPKCEELHLGRSPNSNSFN